MTYATVKMPTHLAAGRISEDQVLDGAADALLKGDGNRIVEALDNRMLELVGVVREEELFQVLVNPETPMELLELFMRELYLEIFSYQPDAIEAAMCTIARLPKIDSRAIRRMMVHQCEEADHGEMALKDYVTLGGNEEYARTRRPSPASFATASVWWGLCKMEHPLAFLGALYAFEGLTPLVAAPVLKALKSREFRPDAMGFIDFHAVADIGHTNLVRFMIKDAVERYPEAAEAIETGLDNFLAVYPIPGWRAAYTRAKAAWAGDSNDDSLQTPTSFRRVSVIEAEFESPSPTAIERAAKVTATQLAAT